MIAADPYGKFIPGPARGLPQYVTTQRAGRGRHSPARSPCRPNVLHFDTPFLTDIAHNADPSAVGHRPQPGHPAGRADARTPTPPRPPTSPASRRARTTTRCSTRTSCAGDGRVNENIALTTIHQVFHSEHDRLVDDIKNTLTTDTSAAGVAALAEWKLATGDRPTAGTASGCSRPPAS